VRYYGKKEHCSHIIAENFLISVRRPDQICIDHITHNPSEYHVNDIRNLRWCTKEENHGFEEARDNISKGMKGLRIGDKNPLYGKGYLRTGEKNPNWKGDNASPGAAYKRAIKLYKAGKITEEEFQQYRDKRSESRRSNGNAATNR
jgi:hypothetical protein